MPQENPHSQQNEQDDTQTNVEYADSRPIMGACFRCGTTNPSNRIFCVFCGYELPDRNAHSDSMRGKDGLPILARLTMRSGQLAGHSYRFHQVVTTIGRTNGNDLIISGRTVSRRHARLWLENGRWYLADMQSANGTLVNNIRIGSKNPVELHDGDIINFGDEIVIFNEENRTIDDLHKDVTPARVELALIGEKRENVVNATERPLSLFTKMRLELEDDDVAFVGKAYSLQVSVSQKRKENFHKGGGDQSATSISKAVLFDILLHESENIELNNGWQISLLYYPLNLESETTELTFRVVTSGKSYLVADFYHERRWLKTIRLDFDAIEKPENINDFSGR